MGRAVAVEVRRERASGRGVLPAWGCRWSVQYLGQAVQITGWALSLESAHRAVEEIVGTLNPLTVHAVVPA